MKEKKFSAGQKWGIVVAVLIIVVYFAHGVYERKNTPRPLRVGFFVGSPYNVPQSDAYAVLDEAIKRYADETGTAVTYVSGIRKDDYGEWLAERFVEGDEPDVFFLTADDLNLYAGIGALKELDNFIEQDAAVTVDDYYSASINSCVYGKNIVALPFESVPTLMFVNKTLLKNEGIAMPSNDWTWADFLAVCRQVTRDADGDGALDQFGCYDFSWQAAAVTNGVALFDDDGQSANFSGAGLNETILFLRELKNIRHGHEISAGDFDRGRVAFRPFSFAEYRAYKPYPWRIKKYAAFHWDCVKLPRGPHGKNISELDTLMVGMSARTDKEDEAWKFMKKLCNDKEIQKLITEKSQGLPVRRDVALNLDFSDEIMNPQIVTEVLNDAVPRPKFARYEQTMLYADREVKRIIAAEDYSVGALNHLQKEITALLQH